MLVLPFIRRMLSATFSNEAMARGPVWVRIWERSFVVGDVADPVQAVFYGTVSADPGCEFGCGGLFGGQPGDGVRDFGGPLLAIQPTASEPHRTKQSLHRDEEAVGSNHATPTVGYGKCRCPVPVSGVVGAACVRGVWDSWDTLNAPSQPRFRELFRSSAAVRTCPTAPVLHKVRRDSWDGLAGPPVRDHRDGPPSQMGWFLTFDRELSPLLTNELSI